MSTVNEEWIASARQQPVAWDEVRERRVLASVEARLDAPAANDRTGMRRAWALALAVAAVLVLAASATLAGSTGETPLSVAAVATEPSQRPADLAAHLDLHDGSRVRLHGDARVEILEQSDTLVRLAQHHGTVDYDVVPDRNRSFVVLADGVEVRVLGTAFTVSMASPHVDVDVQRGRVEVAAASQRTRLSAGEHMRIDAHAARTQLLPATDPAPGSAPNPAPGSAPNPVPVPVPVPVPGSVPGSDPAPDPRPRAAVPSIDALLDQADRARRAGDHAAAATALATLVRAYPRDDRSYGAWFQLGKVQRARGRHADAARAFAACADLDADGALAEDAQAELAAALRAAGRDATATARAYLERWPHGTHAERMRELAGMLDAP